MFRKTISRFISNVLVSSLCSASIGLAGLFLSLMSVPNLQAGVGASLAASFQEQTAQEVTTLEPGKPIDRVLAGWQKHTYHVTVIQGQYVNVTVEQRGIDLSIQLRGVDGNLIAEFDFESRNDGRESVGFVAEASGNYRVEIKPTLKNAPGRPYQIRLDETRVAAERDRSLYEATKLFAEAGRLYEAAKHDEALLLAERASQVLEQALGAENQDFARTINLVANLYSEKKDYVKAEPIFQRALGIRERVLGPEHPDVAASCYDLGRFYLAKGDRAKGEPFTQRALAIRENVLDGDHFHIGLTLSSYARYPYYRQEYAKAEEILSRAATILEKSLGDDNPDYSAALHSLGFIHDTTGDFAKAELLYRRELASREKARGKDSAHAAYVLHYIARVYYRRGEYDEAEALYRRALDIGEKVHDDEGILVALANLASIQGDKGDYERAEILYKQILERHEKAASPNQVNISSVLLNLGATKNNQGDYASAETYLRRALSIVEETRRGEGLDKAHVLRTLASASIGKRDYASAEQLARRALAIYERVNGPNHPYVARVLTQLGQIAYLKGDNAGAESSYRLALGISEKSQGVNNPQLVGLLKRLADVYAAKGDPAQAIEFQSRANAVSEHHLALALATGSERQKLAYLATSASNIDRNLTLNLRSAPVNARASELAVTTLLQLKGRVLDSMTDTLSALRSRANPQDKQLLDQLNETTTQLARRVLNGSQTIVSAENQAQIKALEEKREKLEDEISRRSAEFRAQKQAVTLDSVRRLIPERAALLEFVIYRPHNPRAVNDKAAYGEPRYAVCVIRNHGEALWKELGAAKEIDSAIRSLRLALRDPKRKDVQQIARAVDAKVMQPIRGFLGEATQLFVSPDGELNLIPFAALLDERGRFLIDRHSFTYLSSGRDLLRLQVARASQSNPVVMANPLFGEPNFAAIAKADGPKPQQASLHRKRQSVTTGSDLSDVYFAPLDGTEREAQSIKSLFPEMTLLTGGGATEARLKQAAAPRILHIATHGFFLTDERPAAGTRGTRAISARTKIENPLLRSGLALVGANLRSSGGDDGILTALEAAGLNLWGTKLVVLSACDTGVGEVKNGEGVYGLRRALVLAGAETLVMSLWPVSDYVTREMMTAYYTGLKQGQGRGEALRQVQLLMMKRNGREHPFYWAGFIQSGEWANLEGKR